MSNRLLAHATATIIWLLATGTVSAQEPNVVAGVVMDQSGAVISGAEVTFSGGGRQSTQLTDADGRFRFASISATQGALRVSRAGFAPKTIEWRAQGQSQSQSQSRNGELQVVMLPLPLQERVTITASRWPIELTETAASVSVVDRTELATSGSMTLDGALRRVPGFTLFRRAGSLAANPTTQGLSLRGIGGSGAGRAAVLFDGVALNDPFGGWVYWDRVPQISIEEVEVLRGGASDLYGSGALAGVVQLKPRRPPGNLFSAEAYLGNSLTPLSSALWNWQLGDTVVQASGEAFSSGGYFIVREQDRGSVDTKAGQSHYTGHLGMSHRLRDGSMIFARGSLFREERDNGTAAQDNQTRLGQVEVGADWLLAGGALNVRAHLEGQRYSQSFTAVSDDRNSEVLTRSQIVPAQRTGVTTFYSRPIRVHTLVAGVDFQDVRGHSDETAYAAGLPVSKPDTGGRQRMTGVFLEDIMRLGTAWVVTAGMRVDHWRNFDAFSNTLSLATGNRQTSALAERSETAFSPRLSALRRLSEEWSFGVSAYRAFRAPTLNELYRPFRVGNVLTLANESLQAERLTGGEASLIGRMRGRASFRGTFFWEEVSRPVANLTLNTTAQLITRQRRNLGRTRARGVELQADTQVGQRLTLSAGYQFADTAVVEFPPDPGLIGKDVPQVARHQFSIQGRYFSPRIATIALQGRYVGPQFDDDRNSFVLDRFFTLDAYASRRLSNTVEVFAAAENLLNQRYMVGRTPLITIGPPILARVGLRLEFTRR